LSPTIFNLTTEPIIRAILQLGSGYSLYGESIDVLAYADDLTFVSENPQGLQAILDTAGRVATWARLQSEEVRHVTRRRQKTRDPTYLVSHTGRRPTSPL